MATHFADDFEEITGETPEQYLEKNPEGALVVDAPADAAVVEPVVEESEVPVTKEINADSLGVATE